MSATIWQSMNLQMRWVYCNAWCLQILIIWAQGKASVKFFFFFKPQCFITTYILHDCVSRLTLPCCRTYKISWIKIDQLDVTCFIISIFTAQHVNVSTSIFRSLRHIVDLFHVLYCSGLMCVGVTVWFGWGVVVSGCRLHYLMLNMFRMLIHPFSRACDLFVELFHGL